MLHAIGVVLLIIFFWPFFVLFFAIKWALLAIAVVCIGLWYFLGWLFNGVGLPGDGLGWALIIWPWAFIIIFYAWKWWDECAITQWNDH